MTHTKLLSSQIATITFEGVAHQPGTGRSTMCFRPRSVLRYAPNAKKQQEATAAVKRFLTEAADMAMVRCRQAKSRKNKNTAHARIYLSALNTTLVKLHLARLPSTVHTAAEEALKQEINKTREYLLRRSIERHIYCGFRNAMTHHRMAAAA